MLDYYAMGTGLHALACKAGGLVLLVWSVPTAGRAAKFALSEVQVRRSCLRNKQQRRAGKRNQQPNAYGC